MGKVICLNHSEDKHSLVSHLIKGTPYEFNFFGKNVQIMRLPYLIKKRKEFFNNYWNHFTNEISTIRENEFNSLYLAEKFHSLPPKIKTSVLWECSEIYAFDGKLTYSKFADVVDSYSLRKV
jgi:hypothetical protein